ncbi:MAG: hypothetical protein AAF772_21455, partial [Acidobacteriota bacterium]
MYHSQGQAPEATGAARRRRGRIVALAALFALLLVVGGWALRDARDAAARAAARDALLDEVDDWQQQMRIADHRPLHDRRPAAARHRARLQTLAATAVDDDPAVHAALGRLIANLDGADDRAAARR